MEEKLNPNKKTARIAGVLYLILAVCSGFAFIVHSNLIVPDDASKTISNITNSEMLFRISLMSDLIGQIFFVLTVLILYKLLQTVNKNQALVMLALALIPVPIASINIVSQFTMLQLLNGTDLSFSLNQLHSQTMFFLDLHNYGVFVAQIFWGLWLFPLGYLIFKSGYVPKIIGILLIVAGSGYLIDSLGRLLSANYNLSIARFTFVGELILIFWLLIKGVKNHQAAVSAV